MGKVLFAKRIVDPDWTIVFGNVQGAPRDESEGRARASAISDLFDSPIGLFQIQEYDVESAGSEHAATLIKRSAALKFEFVQSRPFQVGSEIGCIVFVSNDGEKEKRPADPMDRGLSNVVVVFVIWRLVSRHSGNAISVEAILRFGTSPYAAYLALITRFSGRGIRHGIFEE